MGASVLINDKVKKIVKQNVRRAAAKNVLAEFEKEDLEQELYMALLASFPKYDPARGAVEPFANQVVRNRLINMIKAEKRKMRDRALCQFSLNEIRISEGGFRQEKIEAVEHEPSYGSYSFCELLDLGIDIERLASNLPHALRTLCDDLKDKTVMEISREKGVQRSTTYNRVRKLRGIFSEAGMHV